jgi:hypothetical protein
MAPSKKHTESEQARTFCFQQIDIAAIQADGVLSAYYDVASTRVEHCASDKRAAMVV